MGVGHFINDLSFLPRREFLAKEREFPPQKFVRVGSLTDSEITVLAPMKFFANFAGFSGIFFFAIFCGCANCGDPWRVVK